MQLILLKLILFSSTSSFKYKPFRFKYSKQFAILKNYFILIIHMCSYNTARTLLKKKSRVRGHDHYIFWKLCPKIADLSPYSLFLHIKHLKRTQSERRFHRPLYYEVLFISSEALGCSIDKKISSFPNNRKLLLIALIDFDTKIFISKNLEQKSYFTFDLQWNMKSLKNWS